MTRLPLIFLLPSTALLAACSGNGAATYAMSSEQAVAKLMAADARVIGMGGNVTKPSQSGNVVSWGIGDDGPVVSCTATANSVSNTETGIEIACSGSSPSDGAAAGASADVIKAILAEHVSSTLLGRPFDARKAEATAVASMAKALPKMQKDALEMDAQAKVAPEFEAAIVEKLEAEEVQNFGQPQSDAAPSAALDQ